MKTRNRFKKTMAAVLALLMLLCTLSGCGNGANKENSAESKTSSQAESKGEASASSETSSAEEEEERELITIDFLRFNFPSLQETFQSVGKDSEIYKELVNQTGVQFNMIGLDDQQSNIRIVSDDLGDLISINNAKQLSSLIEAEEILPLDDLIDEYGPNIKKNFPSRLDWARGKGNGTIYCLPIQAGGDGCQNTNGRYLYQVRWDLYKELGYPKLENPDDLLDVLCDMVELQPETPTGDKVYATSFYLTTDSFFNFFDVFGGTYGMKWWLGEYVWEDIVDSKAVYVSDIEEERNPFWMAADFYHKAYMRGVLDPDCFTQQAADYESKINSGVVLGPPEYYNTGYERAMRNNGYIGEDDPVGFVDIPVDGCMFFQSSDDDPDSVGWGSARALAIPKSCRYPERVIQMIDYCFSEEGCRLLYNGIEGVHWEYVDGVPVYTEETYKIFDEKTAGNTDRYLKVGFGEASLTWLGGTAEGQILSDGYHANLQRDNDYLSHMEWSPVLKDFCEYYEVGWPNEIFLKKKAEGKMYDLTNLRAFSTEVPEEILRIDALVLKACIEAIPKLVTAADDAAYEAAKQETMATFKSLGAETAAEWYHNEFERLKAEADAK